MVKKILFFCTGNTCRSPMAEGIFRKMLAENGAEDVICESAGLSAVEGCRASGNAAAACEKMGVDLQEHRSRRFCREMVAHDYCLYIPLDTGHLEQFLLFCSSEFPEKIEDIFQKTRLLGCGIPDPYGQDLAYYCKTREAIASALKNLLPLLLPVEVRNMEEKDIERLADLERLSFVHPWSREGLAEELLNENAVFRVAVCADTVLGYAGMHCVIEEGFITNVAVFPEYRRMGIAEKLLENLDAYAAEHALSRITLEVRQSNQAAISLYQKKGYISDGIRKGFYSAPEEDAVIMSKYY